MGMTLTLTPALILARSVQSGFLPLLSRAGDRTVVSAAAVEAGIVGAAALAAVAALALGALILPILGPGFAPLAGLLALLGVEQALRVFRSGATTVALAAGRTGVSLCADAVRALGLVPIAVILWQDGSLAQIVLVGTAFEALACLVAFFGVRDRVALGSCLPAGLAGAATCVAVWLGAGPVPVVLCVVATAGLARNLRSVARAPRAAPSVAA